MPITANRIIGASNTAGDKTFVEASTGLTLANNKLSASADSPGAVNEENIELGQVHLTTATATNVLQAAANEAWLVRQIIITNTDVGANVIDLYHDVDGTTYDHTTALLRGYSLGAGMVLNIDSLILPLEDSTGTIGLATSKSDVTVTFWGIKLDEDDNTYMMLGQAESPVTAGSLYTLPSGKKAVVTGLFVANHTAASKQHFLYWDEDGTTYDKTTAVHYSLAIPGDDFVLFSEKHWTLKTTGGSIGHAANTANDLTVTLYGQETDV